MVEKERSIFARDGYPDKEGERNILANPLKRLKDMQMLRHIKTLRSIRMDETA